ncbi:MAG: nucleotide exchange factor GrpE [Patescibacteria group bacterium]
MSDNKDEDKEDKNSGGELEKCRKEREEYLDGWKRAKADFANYKKEEALRLENFLKFSNELMVRDLVGVLDSFDLGLAVLGYDDPGRKGMCLIQNQLEDQLKKYGLERIPSALGKSFDPSLHEAVAEIDSEKSPGIVVEEIEKGYKLHGKVIRPVRVKISKGQLTDNNKQ